MLIFRVEAWPWCSQGSFGKIRKEFNIMFCKFSEVYVLLQPQCPVLLKYLRTSTIFILLSRQQQVKLLKQ